MVERAEEGPWMLALAQRKTLGQECDALGTTEEQAKVGQDRSCRNSWTQRFTLLRAYFSEILRARQGVRAKGSGSEERVEPAR